VKFADKLKGITHVGNPGKTALAAGKSDYGGVVSLRNVPKLVVPDTGSTQSERRRSMRRSHVDNAYAKECETQSPRLGERTNGFHMRNGNNFQIKVDAPTNIIHTRSSDEREM